jgi:hypothetical protein
MCQTTYEGKHIVKPNRASEWQVQKAKLAKRRSVELLAAAPKLRSDPGAWITRATLYLSASGAGVVFTAAALPRSLAIRNILPKRNESGQ